MPNVNSDLMANLFGDGGIKVNSTTQPEENSNLFRPNSKKGQNGQYTAIIRFVCNCEDLPNSISDKSIISKYTCFVQNPLTKQGRVVDCPSSGGEKDPLTDMFFAIRNSNSRFVTEDQKKKLENSFKRHLEYRSLVQIIDAPHEPALIGKILIFKYGQKIHKKIQDEQTPVMQGAIPGQPFDPFKGRLFKVSYVKDGNNAFDNVDGSMFFDIAYPQNCLRMPVKTVDPTTGQPVVNWNVVSRESLTTNEARQAFLDYLIENSPKLSQFEYKPWDAETKKFVDEMILLHSQILDGQPMNMPQQNAMVNQTIQGQSANPMTATPMPSLGSILGGMNGGVSSTPIQQVANITPPAGMVQTPTANAVSPSVAQPVAPSVPSFGSTPQPAPAPATAPTGLNIGLGSDSLGVPQAPSTPSLGGVSGIDANSLSAIMGSATPQPTPAPSAAPNNVADILKDVMA